MSTKNGWTTSGSSRRWMVDTNNNNNGNNTQAKAKANEIERHLSNICGKKRIMVVVDESPHSKNALIWALTHVANDADIITLLHIITPSNNNSDTSLSHLAANLATLCKASRPQVEIEALVIEGPKMETVMSQVNKLEVSVLILGQRNPPSLLSTCLCLKSNEDEFVEQCIDTMECLTIGVGKQTKGVGGYLIST